MKSYRIYSTLLYPKLHLIDSTFHNAGESQCESVRTCTLLYPNLIYLSSNWPWISSTLPQIYCTLISSTCIMRARVNVGKQKRFRLENFGPHLSFVYNFSVVICALFPCFLVYIILKKRTFFEWTFAKKKRERDATIFFWCAFLQRKREKEMQQMAKSE